MQPLGTRRIRGSRRQGSRISAAWASDLRIGVIAVLVTAIVVAATVLLYVHPPSQQTIRFRTDDVEAIKVGDDVRVAGIHVGKVTAVDLRRDDVEVHARLSDGIFVGDQSRVEVRMLTAVGGYYVTVIPGGTQALGDNAIPMSRVTVPYSIADILQKVPRITDDVSGQGLDANIKQISAGLSGNTEAISSMVSGLDSIARIMDRQRQQVTTTLDLANEYIGTINRNRDFVFALIKKIEIVLARYNATYAGFNETYQLLGDVLTRLSPISWYYYDNRAKVKDAVTILRNGFHDLEGRVTPVIGQLTQILDALKGVIGPDGLKQVQQDVILATDVCVPVPGKRC